MKKILKRRKKLYFLHIPKTAGYSISDSLGRISTQKRLTILGPIILDHLADNPEWAKSDILIGHLGLLPTRYEYDYLTVLRDPLERIYSHYEHIKRGVGHYFHKIIVEENLDFEDYLRDERFARLNFNMQTRYLSSYPNLKTEQLSGHHQEQAAHFENSDESNVNLEIAIDTLMKASWVGSAKTFEDLGAFLEKRFRVSCVQIPFLHVHPGPRKIFTSREKKAAERFIEFDQFIYDKWSLGLGK